MTRVVIDSSVLLAVVLSEPEADRFNEILLSIEPCMSTATRVEVGTATMRHLGVPGLAIADQMVEHYRIELVPFDEPQSRIALAALRDYGKGRRQAPAVLNFGDLFSYALAKARSLPLLYKGEDFTVTDVERYADL